jgi:integrase
MSRQPRTPSYRLHKPSGQAVVTLDGHDIYLGKHDTPESRAEYDRRIAEWLANARRLPVRADEPAGLTVNQLLVAFLRHANEHYRRADGTPTGEVRDYKLSFRPLKHLYGNTPVNDFGPLALKAVRKLMIDGYTHPNYGDQPALARAVVNQRVGRIVRAFKWGVSEELVPETVHRALATVKGLQKGRSPARETEPVRPVADAVVEATLPHMLPPVRAMVMLQRHSGMRSGEVVIMRACDLDVTGKVWLYRPAQHKTAHRGLGRVVPLGPKCQEILRPWLKTDLEAYLFSPREAMEVFWAERREHRKTKVQPSRAHRKRKAKPRRGAGDRYTVASYGKAVARACEKADRTAREAAVKEGRTVEDGVVFVPHWHPHQIRHAVGTALRREAGLDVARAVLGHNTLVTTEHYAALDEEAAVKIMGRLG